VNLLNDARASASGRDAIDPPEPWIAFKVLAAGAITLEYGFRYALEGGADHLCVGIYDFHTTDKLKLANEILSTGFKR